MSPQVSKRSVREGGKNFSPDHPLAIRFSARGVLRDVVRLEIPRSFYFNPSDYGKDAEDWMKAGGRTFINWYDPRTWEASFRATLLGFRCAKDSHRFEACPYTNNDRIHYGKDGGVDLLSFSAREDGGYAELSITSYPNRVYYLLSTETGSISITHPLERFCLSRTVSPWNGGDLPAVRDQTIYTGMLQPKD